MCRLSMSECNQDLECRLEYTSDVNERLDLAGRMQRKIKLTRSITGLTICRIG